MFKGSKMSVYFFFLFFILLVCLFNVFFVIFVSFFFYLFCYVFILDYGECYYGDEYYCYKIEDFFLKWFRSFLCFFCYCVVK